MVEISIINVTRDVTGDTREEEAVETLRNSLDQDFRNIPSASGRICLLTNVTYGGGSSGEIDILMLCDLSGVTFNLYVPDDQEKKDVVVQRLCYILEVKDHDYNGVEIFNNGFNVKYDGVWHPVSSQSRKQRFDFKKYLGRYLGYSPFIYNYLWFREITGNELDSVVLRAKDGISYDDNALPKSFSFKKLVQKTIYVTPDSVRWNKERTTGWMNCCSGVDFVSDITKHFTQRRVVVGQLTQNRLNLLSMKEASHEIQDINSDNLTLFEGRAGTGKTIKLLQVAIKYKNQGKRCILLTFNRALISDINRILFLSGIYSKPDKPTVTTSTLHSFFMELMVLLGIRDDKIIDDADEYFNKSGYKKDLKETYEYITECLSKTELKNFKDTSEYIDWDYILVDEAQDWLEIEKDILYAIYGPERIVVADGVDQFMRSDYKIDWADGVINDIYRRNDEICLRQKPNLVRFVNGFAQEVGLGEWHVKENDQYNGGRVIVVQKYITDLHIELLNDGKKANAVPYDILFLVPPQDVNDGHFIKYELYKQNRISLFDGTNPDNREYFSLDNSLCRLYQYDSCRGLEGWSVICYDFDFLVEKKYEIFVSKLQNGEMPCYMGASIAETAKVMTYMWALMPLTRAIDTLVITLSEPNCEIGKILQKMSRDKRHYDGIIEWRI